MIKGLRLSLLSLSVRLAGDRSPNGYGSISPFLTTCSPSLRNGGPQVPTGLRAIQNLNAGQDKSSRTGSTRRPFPSLAPIPAVPARRTRAGPSAVSAFQRSGSLSTFPTHGPLTAPRPGAPAPPVSRHGPKIRSRQRLPRSCGPATSLLTSRFFLEKPLTLCKGFGIGL